MIRDEQIAMVLGTLSLALIAGALGFQYLGHMAPCEMCQWQRWPHFAAIILGLGGGFLIARGKIGRDHAHACAVAVILLVAASGLVGAYQTGMQYHLVPGPQACTGARYILGSGAPAPAVRCDLPTWFLFGLAMPAYNAIISLGAAACAVFLLLRKR